jgi:hypothetical protein
LSVLIARPRLKRGADEVEVVEVPVDVVGTGPTIGVIPVMAVLRSANGILRLRDTWSAAMN